MLSFRPGLARPALAAGGLIWWVFSGVAAQDTPADLLITGQGIGPVELWMSEADLVHLLGSDAVEHFDAYLGEGMCAPGSIVFPNSDASIEVTWGDTTGSAIVRLSVRAPSVRWRTAAGVGVGVTLQELQHIVGGPFEFLGFKWDYGGRVTWTEDGTEFFLDLAPTDESLQEATKDPLYREIIGDRMIRSDHPLVQRMAMQVQAITVQGPGRSAFEHACGRPEDST